MPESDLILITGSAGFIGQALATRLAPQCRVVGLDRNPATRPMPSLRDFVQIDLTSDDSVRAALAAVRDRHGQRIASVIHLAAYFDLTGDPNPKYEEITIRGTQRLLRELRNFQVEQFVFASTMLVHRAGQVGETISEQRPLDATLPYRASKIKTEQLIHDERNGMPVVFLRPAGVYDDWCNNPFLAHQISRIYEGSFKGHLYPGDLRTGQSFVHLDDLADAVARLIERRRELPPELPLLLGESDVMSYEELQEDIGCLVHGERWSTLQIAKPLAEAGAWIEEEILREDPFIRPWMVAAADDHYAVDPTRAQRLLGWHPQHSLRTTLPKMIAALKADPERWYATNKLDAAKVAGRGGPPHGGAEPMSHESMQRHHAEMHAMHLGMLWPHFLVIALGAWLTTSPLQFGLFDPATAALVARDVTSERALLLPDLRNALTGWSDIAAGLLLMFFGTLALSARLAWAQWGTTAVGLWLLFAPLLFWSPSAAAYTNDTAVGALAIAFSVLVPMMPGMSHEGMMDDSVLPPGWSYSPSSWLQRLPIIALGFFGFLIARYLAAYQLGHVADIWEPFFSGGDGRNGTEFIITSHVSRAWPIADAGLGATSYMIEVLMGAMGAAHRWRTMPWMVMFFFILVVPLGGVSIFFILIQPVVLGTYCTLCLIAAFAMLLMIPLTLDEVVAMGQYMLRSHRAGRPFLRTFLQGGPEPAGRADDRPGFGAPLATQGLAGAWGVTIPWQLGASCVIGAWLMFSRTIFEVQGAAADGDHLAGALIITVAIIAMAEVARPLRFVNVMFGAWLLAQPWLLTGASGGARWNDVLCGLLVIALSLPRGWRSREHYGAWDRYVV